MGERLAGTVLQRGQVIPGASLREAGSDRDLPILRLRGRKALVLGLLHDGCAECDGFLAHLSESAPEIAAADGRVLRVARGDPAFERLLGPEGLVPTILVTDRYAAAWESHPAPDHDFPPVEDVLSTLWHLATMCPECGVPTWE